MPATINAWPLPSPTRMFAATIWSPAISRPTTGRTRRSCIGKRTRCDSVEGVRASLSLLVSVQTHLLDTRPRIGVASQVPSSGASAHRDRRGRDKPTLSRSSTMNTIMPIGSRRAACFGDLTGCAVSYVEIVCPPAIFVREVRTTPHGEIVRRMASVRRFLEKGVIRRARVHAALLPRENDVELAIECCRGDRAESAAADDVDSATASSRLIACRGRRARRRFCGAASFRRVADARSRCPTCRRQPRHCKETR